MANSILAIIGGFITLVILVLTKYVESKPERKEKDREKEIAQGREDIITGNVDAVSSRIDRLLQKIRNRTAGSADSKNTKG